MATDINLRIFHQRVQRLKQRDHNRHVHMFETYTDVYTGLTKFRLWNTGQRIREK